MSRAFHSIVLSIAVLLGASPAWIPQAHASKTKSGSTRVDVQQVDHFRYELERDLGRPIRADEWPHILFDAPPAAEGWNGPYARQSFLTDSWRNQLALKPEVGVYSFGANRMDDGGMKDDIASWRSIDRSYYPKPPITLRELPYLVVPPVFLMMLIGIPAWMLWRPRKRRIASR